MLMKGRIAMRVYGYGSDRFGSGRPHPDFWIPAPVQAS
jgi:hypothetical protein